MADTRPAYDRRIEQAAIEMLQPKLGDIRGTLDLNTETHLYPPLSERNRARAEAEVPELLPFGTNQGSILRY